MVSRHKITWSVMFFWGVAANLNCPFSLARPWIMMLIYTRSLTKLLVQIIYQILRPDLWYYHKCLQVLHFQLSCMNMAPLPARQMFPPNSEVDLKWRWVMPHLDL